jgi:hypothetical protein
MEFRIDLAPPAPWPADAGPQPVEALPAAEAQRQLTEARARYDLRRHLDRLAQDELQRMVDFQVAVEDLENRRSYFRTTPVEQTFQGQVIPLLERLLETDPTIRSVMNIGARYAFVDNVLARRFPGVQFVGVDFMPNLAEMNREFQLPNLTFVTGYARELLRSRQIRADVIFFSSTALTINAAELRSYARLIAATARYILFNEPVHHSPDGGLVNPLELAVDGSAPVRIQPGGKPEAPLNVVHNYKGIVEEAGFKILHYAMGPFPPFEPYLLQLVAVKDLDFAVDPAFPAAQARLDSSAEGERAALRARAERGGQRDRLSEDELTEMMAFQLAVEDVLYRRAHFRDTPLHLTVQGQAVPLVEAIVRRDPAVRSLVDIGVRYAYVDHVLAEKFPAIDFVGVDFMPNLAEMNAEFRRPNLRFEVGYALEMLEAGRLRGDVALMVDTALTIRNRELRRYFALLASTARYVVIVDPLHRSPGGGLEDPLGLPVDESLPVYTPPVKVTPLPGPVCYRHNYKAMLEEAGFSVVHYKVSPLGHYDLNLVSIVARRPVS